MPLDGDVRTTRALRVGVPLEIQLITALEECEFHDAPTHGLIYEPAPDARIDVKKLALILSGAAN